jgi:protein-L-isoaspartate(D-aspartate) O-methyltransferase
MIQIEMRRFLVLLLCAAVGPAARDPLASEREAMVRQQIIARGVHDNAVLRSMMEIPRHLFVPEPLRSRAYDDLTLPIGDGQTISQPYIVALMSQLLGAGADHRVLEIGTGSGYQAAVLSLLAKEVFSIELVPRLATEAREKLGKLGYGNVTVRAGDGYKGWPEQAPFDRIILTAAPDEIPPALLDQLKPGGRLVAPVGDSRQQLVVVEKDFNGQLRRRTVLGVRFVPMVRGK